MTTSTSEVNTNLVDLTEQQRKSIAVRKATCPFIGSAVNSGDLKVLNSAEVPLAAIENVAELGDTGGGKLGSIVLTFFATGNHSRMPGPVGEPGERVPQDHFSLDLAGSPGAHWGHSGILLDDPTQRNSGDFDKEAFQRLADLADGGLLTTQAFGKFIADNLKRDKGKAKVLPFDDLKAGLHDVFREAGETVLGEILEHAEAFFARILPGVFDSVPEHDDTELVEKLTALARQDNLVGSAGEFALLFALLAGQPAVNEDDGMVIRLKDVELMMKEHQLPDGWEDWPKSSRVWLHATMRITASAAKAHFDKDIGVSDFLKSLLSD